MDILTKSVKRSLSRDPELREAFYERLAIMVVDGEIPEGEAVGIAYQSALREVRGA